MKKRCILFFMTFTLLFIFNIKCYAADIRILSINGGSASDDNSFLYSASMFYACMEEMYVNNIKVKPSNCRYYKDPTYSQIGYLIKSAFGNSKSDDISIFYYSGHGTYTKSTGAAGIYTSDGQNYEFKTLYKMLEKFSGKKLVILDCCYSGAFIKENAVDASKFKVLTACSEDSYSPSYNRISLLSLFNKKKVNMTQFSNVLLTGLGYFDGKLKADKNDNKVVTTNELYSYLQKNYQKTYSATDNNGKKILFKAVPQKCGNIEFSFSRMSITSDVTIKLNKSSANIYKNESLKLQAIKTGTSKSVTWKSSNTKIATVNSSGKVTGRKAGTAVITAKVNGKTAQCKIKVKNPSIKLNKSKASVYLGDTLNLKATVLGASKTVKWSTSNKKIATVNSRGAITTKKAGKVTITAKANGKTVKCTVTVKDAFEKMKKEVAQGSWWSSGFKYSLGFSKGYAVIGNTYGRKAAKYKIKYVQVTSYGYFVNIPGYHNYRWYRSAPHLLQCYSSASGNAGRSKSADFTLFHC